MITTIAVAAVCGLLAWVGFSLRDFSRSRLEEICRDHNRDDRFGEILINHERALLACEALYLVLLVVTGGLATTALDLWAYPVGGFTSWLTQTSTWILLLLATVSVLVILPWTLARVLGERLLFHVWPGLKCLTAVAAPLLKAAVVTDRIVHRLAGVPEPDHAAASTLTDEIRSVVEEGQRGGVLKSGASTMIHRVMELQEDDVAAIMTPRTDMVTLHVEATFEDARKCVIGTGHSRVPVIGKSTDDIVGILYARDLLECLHVQADPPRTLQDIVREPFYVPETMGIGNLLEAMKRDHVQLAIVVDEYSGVAGLVSMEDILEEIVGEIADEYDGEEPPLIHTDGNGQADVDARVHIDDLNEQFDYGLPEDGDYDTIGGFALAQFGRIPDVGESFPWQDLRVTVLEADKRRLRKLRIERSPKLAASR